MRIRIKNALIFHKVTLDLEVSEEAWERYKENEDIDALVYNESSEFLEEDVNEDETDYDFWVSNLEIEEI